MSVNYITSTSYDNFKRNVSDITRISKSKDPYRIINDYENRARKLELVYQNRLRQVASEIDMAMAPSTNSADALERSIGTGVAGIAKISAQNRLAKEKAKLQEELRQDKLKLLKKIQKDILKDFSKKEDKYMQRAAAEAFAAEEKYYSKMASFYDCKIRKVKSNFSEHNTSWVDPYCDEPSDRFQKTYRNPTHEELYNAAVRKKRNSNPHFQKASQRFVDMAINKNPDKPQYYYFKSGFYQTGSEEHLHFIAQALKLDPNDKRMQDEFFYSMAENKKTSESFKIYIERFPRGKFIQLANRKLLYYELLEEVNRLAEAEILDKGSIKYIELKSNSLYNPSEVPGRNLLEEHIAYKNAVAQKEFKLLEAYTKTYPYGRYIREVQGYLNDQYIHVADGLFKNKNYKKASEQYQNYIQKVGSAGYQYDHALQMKKRSDNRYWVKRYRSNQLVYSYNELFPVNISFTKTGGGIRPYFKLGGNASIPLLKDKSLRSKLYAVDDLGSAYLYEEISKEWIEVPSFTVNSIKRSNTLQYENIHLIAGLTYPVIKRLWVYGGVGIAYIRAYEERLLLSGATTYMQRVDYNGLHYPTLEGGIMFKWKKWHLQGGLLRIPGQKIIPEAGISYKTSRF